MGPVGPLNAHDSTTSMDKTDEIFLGYMLWDEILFVFFFSGIYSGISIGLSPLPVTVTTRIITFLVGDPNLNLHLPQASWEGGHTQDIKNITLRWFLNHCVGGLFTPETWGLTPPMIKKQPFESFFRLFL